MSNDGRGARSRQSFVSSPWRLLGWSLLAVLAIARTPAVAVHDTGVFELDGNAAATGVDDFNTIYGGPGLSFDHAFVNDASNPDTTFHAGTNDDRDGLNEWHCITSSNPLDRRDLRHAYTAAYMVNGDLHLFFGADRGANSGAAWFGLWLFQQPVQCDSVSGNFFGRKIDGDLFIVSSFDESGAVLSIKVYRWTDPDGAPESGDEFLGNGVTSGTALASGVDCTLPNPHSGSPDICGAINTATTSVDWEGSALAQKRYFEGGVNLSALFRTSAFSHPVCYSTFLAETRGSATLAGQPFDYATGDVDTCASLMVNTVTDPSADPQQFNFAVTGGPDAVNDAFQLADATTPHITFDLKPGSYAVTETVPSVWDLANATCVGGPFGGGGAYTNGGALTLNFGDHVTCTFHNVKKRGRITVDKVTAPSGDGQQFNFTVSGGPDAVNEVFQLADATAPHTTQSLRPGAYSISEDAQTGWDLSGVTCTGGQFGGGGTYLNGGTINTDWGDVINCTFTNIKRGSLTVDKVTAPVGDPQTFDFILAGGPDTINDVFQLTDTAAPHVTTNLRPGVYTLTETTPAGWDFSTATCVGGSFGPGGPLTNGGTITLTPGAQITCMVTDIRRSRIIMDEVTTPGADPQLFKFTLSGKPTAGGKAVHANFQLADANTPFSFEVKPGTYKVMQKKAKGWTRTGVICAGGPFGGGNPYDNKSKFTLLPTDVVTCTYSNSKP